MQEERHYLGHYVFVCLLCGLCGKLIYVTLVISCQRRNSRRRWRGVPIKKNTKRKEEEKTTIDTKVSRFPYFHGEPLSLSLLYIPCVIRPISAREKSRPAWFRQKKKKTPCPNPISLKKGLGSMSPAYRPLKRRLFMFSLQSSQYHFAADYVSKPSP